MKSNSEASKQVCPFMDTTPCHGCSISYCITELCMSWNVIKLGEGSMPHGECVLLKNSRKGNER